MRSIFKKLFGALALLMGTVFLGLVIFNLFDPTSTLRRGFSTLFQVALSLSMIWLGWNWLRGESSDQETESVWVGTYPHFVFVKILDPISPTQRGQKYEAPLQQALEDNDCGEVTGGGSEIDEAGKIAWVGIDIELADLKESLDLVRRRLHELGAPPGSTLEFQEGDRQVVLPIT